jgi:hypothetical protein
MSLNKKSIIQIVVLVVLLAVGGGVFLMQQEEGGLDLGFLSGLLGGDEPAPPPAAKAPAAAPGAPAQPAPPAIPATPARGQVHGKDFAVDKATLQGGSLTLQETQGAAEVRITRLYNNYEVPAGKTFKVAAQPKGDAPVIEVFTVGASGPRMDAFSDKYTLTLEFGKEKDRKIPGKLSLTLPGEAKTKVAGTFEAAITGFRIVDGKPDLSADDTETLGYLALREILKDDPDKVLADPLLRDMRINTEGVPSGYVEAVYGVAGGAPVVQRFQFVKEKGEWRVMRTLRTDQIHEAHPVQVPGAKDKPDALFPYLAARKLEADTNKKNPKKGIFVSAITARHSDKHKVGDAVITYRVEGSDQPQTVTYLFRQKTGGWVLDRTLGAKERLNLENGRIEKRA